MTPSEQCISEYLGKTSRKVFFWKRNLKPLWLGILFLLKHVVGSQNQLNLSSRTVWGLFVVIYFLLKHTILLCNLLYRQSLSKTIKNTCVVTNTYIKTNISLCDGGVAQGHKTHVNFIYSPRSWTDDWYPIYSWFILFFSFIDFFRVIQ